MGVGPADGVELYRSSFARRSTAASEHQTVVDAPGVCGVLGTAEPGSGRLLITDDRALAALADLGPDLDVHVVTVLKAAPQCRAVIEAAGPWRSEDVTAMVCRDLAALPVVLLADGLTIRPVYRAFGDPDDGVPLVHAAEACLRFSQHTDGDPVPRFLAYLSSLPASTAAGRGRRSGRRSRDGRLDRHRAGRVSVLCLHRRGVATSWGRHCDDGGRARVGTCGRRHDGGS